MISASLLCLVLLLLLPSLELMNLSYASPQETGSEIIIPWASSAEADGYIKPGEYDDALEINLTRGNWVAYLYLKHDGKFLYVFLDHVSDTKSWNDECFVAIDTLSDGGDAPKEDDYLFDATHHIWLGDGPHQADIPGGQWEELKGHGKPYPDLEDKRKPFLEGKEMGWTGFGRSANSLTRHTIFEIKIPIEGWEIEEKRTFGFCVAAGSPETEGTPPAKVVWPEGAYDYFTADFWPGGANPNNPNVIDPQVGTFPPPSTWGTATLSDVPPGGISGGSSWFYIIVIGTMVTVSAVIIVLLMRRLR
mgnify:CR=1 FL=1